MQIPRINSKKQTESNPDPRPQDYRKKELLRITNENQAILKRIQRAQPMYNHVAWEAEHRYVAKISI